MEKINFTRVENLIFEIYKEIYKIYFVLFKKNLLENFKFLKSFKNFKKAKLSFNPLENENYTQTLSKKLSESLKYQKIQKINPK